MDGVDRDWVGKDEAIHTGSETDSDIQEYYFYT